MMKACGWALVLLAVGAIVGCANEPQQTNTVRMTGVMTYAPAAITVNAGDKVTWKNDSLMIHTVTDDPALAKKSGNAVLPAGAAPFNSGNIDPGKTWEYTFVAPGTYKYFCIPHEMMGMVGTVIVRPAGGSAPVAPAAPAAPASPKASAK